MILNAKGTQLLVKSIIYKHMFVLYTYIFDYSVSLSYLHPHPLSVPYISVYFKNIPRPQHSSSRTTYLFWFWFLGISASTPSFMYISSTSFSILLTFFQTPVFVLKLPLSSEWQYHVTPRIYSISFFSFRLHFYPCNLPCSRHYPHFPPHFPCQYPHFTPYSSSLSSHVTPPSFYYYQHFILFLFDTSFFPLRGPYFPSLLPFHFRHCTPFHQFNSLSFLDVFYSSSPFSFLSPYYFPSLCPKRKHPHFPPTHEWRSVMVTWTNLAGLGNCKKYTFRIKYSEG